MKAGNSCASASTTRLFGRLHRPSGAAASARLHPRTACRCSHRLQGRPSHPIARRFRQAGRTLRRERRLLRLGHSGVQCDDHHGSADPQCSAVLRPVRTRGHRRTHSRQDRRIEEEGPMDGRGRAAWLSARRAKAICGPGRGRFRAPDLRSLSRTRVNSRTPKRIEAARHPDPSSYADDRQGGWRPASDQRPALSHSAQPALSRRDQPPRAVLVGGASGHHRSRDVRDSSGVP